MADPTQIVVGIRTNGIEVDFSAHRKFTADSAVARVNARVDWGVNHSTGLVQLTTTP